MTNKCISFIHLLEIIDTSVSRALYLGSSIETVVKIDVDAEITRYIAGPGDELSNIVIDLVRKAILLYPRQALKLVLLKLHDQSSKQTISLFVTPLNNDRIEASGRSLLLPSIQKSPGVIYTLPQIDLAYEKKIIVGKMARGFNKLLPIFENYWSKLLPLRIFRHH